MSIRLTVDEAWEAVESAHTGIHSPGWHANCVAGVVSSAHDRSVALMTPAGTKKIARIRHDPRASFLVESGEQYAELRGIHLTGRVEAVEDALATSRIEAAVQAKYAAFRPPADSLPAAAQAYYAKQVLLRFVPEGPNPDMGQRPSCDEVADVAGLLPSHRNRH